MSEIFYYNFQQYIYVKTLQNYCKYMLSLQANYFTQFSILKFYKNVKFYRNIEIAVNMCYNNYVQILNTEF